MEPQNVTILLKRLGDGQPDAVNKLLPLVYAELKRIAQKQMRGENDGHTLQPTALVHEAFMSLTAQQDVNWQNRAHFLAIASQIMRRVLIDHARARLAKKRGGSVIKVSLIEDMDIAAGKDGGSEPDFLALDAALEKLQALDPRQVRIVEMRFFSGLSIEDTASVLNISAATVKRDWLLAKAFLLRELQTSH